MKIQKIFTIQKNNANNNEKKNEVVLANADYDRTSDRIFISKWNLENFMKNPVMLFHHDPMQILGKWENIRIEGDNLIATPFFADTEIGREKQKLFQDDILISASISFLPGKKEQNEKGGYDYIEGELVEVSLTPLPANPSAIKMKTILPYKEFPLDDIDAEWDAAEEIREVEDVEELKNMCIWYNEKNPDIKTSYKLPIRRNKKGEHKVVFKAVVSAIGALNGARGGVDIPGSERKEAYNICVKEYKRFKPEEEPPELKEIDQSNEAGPSASEEFQESEGEKNITIKRKEKKFMENLEEKFQKIENDLVEITKKISMPVYTQDTSKDRKELNKALKEIINKAIVSDVPSYGGAAIPATVYQEIVGVAEKESIFLQYANKDFLIEGSNYVIPVLDPAVHNASSGYFGGFAFTFGGEGTAITESSPVFLSRNGTLKQCGALASVSPKWLDVRGDQDLIGYMGKALGLMIDYQCLNGTTSGTGFEGIIEAAGSLAYTRAVANDLQLGDITGMLSYFKGQKGYWIAHPSIIPKLTALVTTGGYPVFAIDITKEFPGTLFGMPLFFLDCAKPLGTKGDLILASLPDFYIVANSKSFEIAVSKEFLFNKNLYALRLVWEVGGLMWNSKLITVQGSRQVSPFVVLAS